MKKVYQCETPGCTHKPYETKKAAEACEAQGILGPEVRPGLIIARGNKKDIFGYKIFIDPLKEIKGIKESRNHQRLYHLVDIREKLILEHSFRPLNLSKFERKFTGKQFKGAINVSTGTNWILTFSQLMTSFKLSQEHPKLKYKFLTDNEFKRINNLIENHADFSYLRRTLRRKEVNELHNNDSQLLKAIADHK